MLNAGNLALVAFSREVGNQQGQVFALVVAEADGAVVDPPTAQSLHQQIIRLTDDAGPLWADALFADELRRFRWETARCGLCGGLGHPLEGS